MPSIIANVTQQVLLPANQEMSGTGSGTATVLNSGVVPIVLSGSTWIVGPFTSNQTISIATTSAVTYEVGLPLVALLSGAKSSSAQAAATQALVSGAGEAYGVDYNATAALNVARMNLALQQNRVVTLTKPGQYLFGGSGQGGLLIPSNTTLICGDRVELIVADNTFQPLLRNASAYAAGVTLAAGITLINAAGRVRADATNIHLTYPQGSWISVQGLAGSDANNRGYQGIFQVTDVAANQIFWTMYSGAPSGGNSAAGAIIYPVDTNIKVIGGIWDGNRSGQLSSGYAAGDPRQFVNGFRNVQGLTVRGTTYRKGQSWCIGPNYVMDAVFENITADLNLDATSGPFVAIQGAGWGRNVTIDGMQGGSLDNFVAWSLDSESGPPYPNYWPGDVYGLKIRNVHARNNGAAICALWGNTNYKFHDVEVDGLSGRSDQAAFQISTYAPTAMLNCNGVNLKIKNIAGTFGSAAVLLRSDGNWEQITIDNLRNDSIAQSPLVQLSRSATTQVIKRLDISNLLHAVPGSSGNRTQPLVEIGDSSITSLKVENTPETRVTAVSLVRFIGTLGSVTRAVIDNAQGVASASGTTFIASCENTNATALGQLVVRDSTMTATGGAGGIVQQTATGRVTAIRYDNSTQTGGVSNTSLLNGVNPATVTTVTAA